MHARGVTEAPAHRNIACLANSEGQTTKTKSGCWKMVPPEGAHTLFVCVFFRPYKSTITLKTLLYVSYRVL
jgi:hypothetical protein